MYTCVSLVTVAYAHVFHTVDPRMPSKFWKYEFWDPISLFCLFLVDHVESFRCMDCDSCGCMSVSLLFLWKPSHFRFYLFGEVSVAAVAPRLLSEVRGYSDLSEKWAFVYFLMFSLCIASFLGFHLFYFLGFLTSWD